MSEQTLANARKHTKKDPKVKVPVIDVTRAGFFKVLGRGAVPKVPVIVKAKFFSASAEKKIARAGGVCVLTA